MNQVNQIEAGRPAPRWQRGRIEGRANGVPAPKVSVITAVYNASEALAVTIDAIRAQRRDDLEFIIVDGGSKDATVSVIRQNKEIVDWWLSEADNGIYDAWNKALEVASGTWILFLGAGDRPGAGWFGAVAASDPAWDLVYGTVLMETSAASVMSYFKLRGPDWEEAIRRLPVEMCIPHVGLAHHRRLFLPGRFDSSYKIIGDWEFLIRVRPAHGRRLEHVQAIMPFGGASNSARHARRHFDEIRRALAANGSRLDGSTLVKWRIKLILGFSPGLFESCQRIYWKYYRSRVNREAT
jgi:glycosyltransferase involved in cell wall biosynthesis